MTVKVTKPQVNVREEVSKLAGLGSLAYQDSDYVKVGGLIVKEDSDTDSVLNWPAEINLNSSTEWSGSYNLSNSGNHGPIALYLNNDDTSITESEVSLLMSAGGSGSGQHQITVKRTGTNTGDLIFLRRTSGGASDESLRIDTNGNIGVGESTPSVTGKGVEIFNEGNDTQASLRLSACNNTGSPGQKFNSEIQYNGAAGWYRIMHYGSGDSVGTERFRIDAGGDSYTNDGTISSISDIRVKKDILDLNDGLDLVNQLRPVTFKYNGLSSLATDDNDVKYGFIADEVQAVAPQYVKEHREEINGEIVEDFKSLSTGRMIPMMIKAIQELSAQVETLQAEINTLKGE